MIYNQTNFGYEGTEGIMVDFEEMDDGVVITLPAILDFIFLRHFRDAYHPYPEHTKYRLDFGNVVSIDSSILGLLLQLNKHNGANKDNIQIVNCSKRVDNIFSIANFDRLFTII
jgi:HptB-dependent secretion and biofilm anti anti-sigma factor